MRMKNEYFVKYTKLPMNIYDILCHKISINHDQNKSMIESIYVLSRWIMIIYKQIINKLKNN